MKKRFYLTLLAIICITCNAVAGDTMVYGYATSGDTPQAWGTNKAETYDVAISLNEKFLSGKRVKSVKIPLYTQNGITNCSVWLTKVLTLKSKNGVKVNVPDIASYNVTPENDCINMTFDEPYTITDDGVYVGFSITVSTLDYKSGTPIMIGGTSSTEGCYIHTSSSYKIWNNMNNKIPGMASTMEVTLEGEIADNAVEITKLYDANVQKSVEISAKALLTTHGSQNVNSIDYNYTIGNILTGSKHIDLDQPIEGQYGNQGVIDLPLPAIDNKGEYDLTVTITKVNGEDNKDNVLAMTSSSKIRVYSFVAESRPVYEEYTGTWCQYCPKGFVAIEEMTKRHPDDFIAISYHNDDPMEIMYAAYFPSYIGGYPSAYLNRSQEIDPYSGSSGAYNQLGVEDDWLALRNEISTIDISLNAQWNETDDNEINVNTTVKFGDNYTNAGYKLAYALTADDLCGTDNEAWTQRNNFSGATEYASGPGMEQFVNAPTDVSGLKFRDVIILGPDCRGIAGSIPSNIEDSKEYNSTYTFYADEAVSLYNQKSLIQDRTKLNVVGMILDRYGRIVNAFKAKVTGGTSNGIDNTCVSEKDIKDISYYDYAGRKTSEPKGGLFIKKVTYRDGSVSTRKIVKK